jgi:hypothetical protein
MIKISEFTKEFEAFERFFENHTNLSHHREDANKLFSWLLTGYKDFDSIKFEEGRNCLTFIVTTKSHHRMRIEFNEGKMIILRRWVIGESKNKYAGAFGTIQEVIDIIKGWQVYKHF